MISKPNTDGAFAFILVYFYFSSKFDLVLVSIHGFGYKLFKIHPSFLIIAGNIILFIYEIQSLYRYCRCFCCCWFWLGFCPMDKSNNKWPDVSTRAESFLKAKMINKTYVNRFIGVTEAVNGNKLKRRNEESKQK